MKIIESRNIDCEKWNAKVAEASFQNPVVYSWALDILSDHWAAIVDSDYSFFLPIPYEIKSGVKRVRQHWFSRQLDFVGESKLLREALKLVETQFSYIDVNLNKVDFETENRCFQLLNLTKPENYSTNTRRILNKNKEIYQIQISNNLSHLIEFYSQHAFQKIQQPEKNLKRIQALMNAFIERGKGYVVNAILNDKVVGSLFVIEDKQTAYYLIGDAYEQSMKQGVMFVLMDYAIRVSREKGFLYFDFGGSNVSSVAAFYLKFGPDNFNYSRFLVDKTPFWFKLIRKLKK